MRREEFTQSRFILTEGFEDSAFARAVILGRNPRLPAMDIDPVDNIGEKRGKYGFADAILAADGKRNFSDVSDIVLLADNDEKPATAFEEIQRQIETANKAGLQRTWAIPDRAGIKAPGNPSVSIWMWPEPGTPGCIETLLWRAIKGKHGGISACVDRACICTGADKWPVQKHDKARVRGFLTFCYKRNPTIRFDVLWRDAPEIIPIGRKEFNEFASFLRSI